MVPYIRGMVRSGTRRALAFGSPAPTYVALDPADPYAYGRLVLWLWSARCTFVIIEQDMVPPVGAIRGLLDCPEPWCTHAYLVSGHRVERCLGVAKLSAALTTEHPELVRRVLCRKREGKLDVPWSSVDSYLARGLQGLGFRHHLHEPDAVHLHEYE